MASRPSSPHDPQSPRVLRPGLVARLMLVYAAGVAVLLFSAWWGQRSLMDAERSALQLSDLGVEMVQLTSNLQSILQDKGRIADILISGDRPNVNQVRPHRLEFQMWLDQMAAFTSTLAERNLLDRIRSTYASYTEKADNVLALQQASRDREAQRLFSSMASDIEGLLGDTHALFSLVQRDMSDRRARMDEILDRGQRTIGWITGAGALFSLVLGFLLSRYAARPIYRIALRLGSSGVVDEVAVAAEGLEGIEARVGALIERVVQQERALQHAEKLSELGEIASEIAHETLNPLAGVKGMLQALRKTRRSPEEFARELTDMEKQIDRVDRIVRRLMDYARPLEPHLQIVPVGALLEEAARSAKLSSATHEHDVVVACEPDKVAWRLDPDLMQQVLVNLLVNACEASSAGSSVELRGAVEDGYLSLSVEDHGSGIPYALRERLFRPFFTTKPTGNGLGLAVSRKIVREHGGKIEALAAQGGGSVFRILLPQ